MKKGSHSTRAADIDRLARVYIEPTNRCNLDCRTCMRQGWEEGLGFMEFELFEKIISGLRFFKTPPGIFFGGYGEPLSHPRIAEMVALAKAAGGEVELISNGILLDGKMAGRLTDAGLNRLWVSIDGASPASYADVRLGDHLPEIIANLESLQKKKRKPELGISFVAMQRNIVDLPAVLELAQRLGATRFSLSNVEPYTEDMEKEVLYDRVVFEPLPEGGVRVPRVDAQAIAAKTLERLDAFFPGALSFLSLAPGRKGLCPFLERRSASVRWDGRAAPCLPLLHGHTVFPSGHSRTWPEFNFGSLSELSLADLWHSDAWRDFRGKLDEFSFAPCSTCNSCDLPDINNEDCFGNVHPACGGCLWSQGFIQCP